MRKLLRASNQSRGKERKRNNNGTVAIYDPSYSQTCDKTYCTVEMSFGWLASR